MPTADVDTLLFNAVLAALNAAGIGRGARLYLALSGGVDSVTLLHLLARARRQLHFQLHALHVHHGLQAAADEWPDFCRALCRELRVGCTVLRVQVKDHSPHGTQAAARRARLRALSEKQGDDGWLLLAHHLDDQAETVLYRLLRGSGVRGLAAMRAAEPARRILRPLLNVRRAEIEAYARAHALRWVEDPSNAHAHYARNHLRQQVFPAFAPHFADAAPALARAAEHLQESAELLAQLADIDLAHCGGEPVTIARLLALPPARQANLLRHLYFRRHALPPPAAQIREILRQLGSAARPALNQTDGQWLLVAHQGLLSLCPAPAPTPPAPHGWRGDEESIPWGRGIIQIARARGQGLAAQKLQAALDAGELFFAPRWAGLRLRTHAGGGAKSFKNLCQERNIPAILRPHLPVLRWQDEALWIAEVGSAAEWRCGANEDGIVLRYWPNAPQAGA